jgi:nickel-dependent lactate racemase
MQRIELNYGRGRLPVALPDEIDVRVIRKRQMPVLPYPEAAIREALAEPTEAPPLADLARGKESACILICDITRPVPNGMFLPILVEQLLEAGLCAGRITILIATGLHRPSEDAELAELIGSRWVLETVTVANHFARDDGAHVDLGTTRTHSVPVKLDRRFVEADLKIATGLVEPHFMAGYSGGRKVIAPGVAHKDTITTFHSARFMEHARATSCVLDGNPLHESQLEIVEMLGGALALNTVIDEERRLSFVNFGEIVASHLDAVRFMSEYAEVPVPERFSTVVTSAAGYPLDKTYYQTVKGMVTPMEIMASGADLIIASACSEGMGSSEFVEAQRRLVEHGPERFLEEIGAKRFADIDEWQTEMQLKPMRTGSIQLYSDGLAEPDRALTGVEMIPSVEAAVEASVARSGDPRVAVIPEGPYVVPVYRPAA